ncbi:hypothetical protein O4H66_15755 [Comamonadaceae bacterium G21597-S1]|nr:hypothetical protein [Comamonadaceae bacterium G21597-S1]
MKTALLVGGTAATGVAIAAELRTRGYRVTVYHRGQHELPELSDLEHIHGDPHHGASIEHDLARRDWDVTVATYGRIRHLAQALRGRTGHFVSIGGMPVVSAQPGVPLLEHHPYETQEHAPAGLKGLLPRIVETEQAVMAAHARGDFVATVVRYPYIYGPHAVVTQEWPVIKRILDGRLRWILQGDGLLLRGRCASPNAARLVGLVLDQPSVSGGALFHAGDTRQFTQREWLTLIAGIMGFRFEFVDIPIALSPIGRSAVPMAGDHTWSRSVDVESGVLRHALVSNELSRHALGYADAVSPEDWLRKTVAHWLEYPPHVDGQSGRLEARDFDYAAEDELLAYWDRVVAAAPRCGSPLLRAHPYDHPRAIAAPS